MKCRCLGISGCGLPVINLVDIPLENKARVEVLKGAASLYYDFVPPSGIVNPVTKRAGKVRGHVGSAQQPLPERHADDALRSR